MSTISTEAALSKRYTNHSLRATTVTLLDDAGQESRHIMAVTEHASASSLLSYSRTSAKKRKEMSNILSRGLAGEGEKHGPLPLSPNVQSLDSTNQQPEPQNQLDVPEPQNQLDVPEQQPEPQLLETEVDRYVQQNLTQNNTMSRSILQPIFNNCNVTINYNFSDK